MSTSMAILKEIPVMVSEELWEEAAWLPCVFSVDLQVHKFTVRDLLQLEKGTVLETQNINGADVPVLVNAQRIGWAEFEVVGQRLAVRITELA
jgi:flagellar motor switch/type III secretory pathway protein FliN